MSAILKAASITGKIGSGGILIGAKEAVQYIPQELTEDQRTQARENIGAANVETVDGLKDDLNKEAADRNSAISKAVNEEKNRAIARENEIEELFTMPTQEAVNKWLDEHPEATTTVQDHSLTIDKIAIGALGYITPQMYGAKGDGKTDDSAALQLLVDTLQETGGTIVLSGKYRLEKDIIIKRHSDNEFPITFLGVNEGTIIFGKGAAFTGGYEEHDKDHGNIKFINVTFRDSDTIFRADRKLIRVHCDNCTFSNIGSVVLATDVTQSYYFTNCIMWGCDYVINGTEKSSRGYDIKINLCRIERCNNVFYMPDSPSYETVISNCCIESISGCVASFGIVRTAKITDNYFEKNKRYIVCNNPNINNLIVEGNNMTEKEDPANPEAVHYLVELPTQVEYPQTLKIIRNNITDVYVNAYIHTPLVRSSAFYTGLIVEGNNKASSKDEKIKIRRSRSTLEKQSEATLHLEIPVSEDEEITSLTDGFKYLADYAHKNNYLDSDFWCDISGIAILRGHILVKEDKDRIYINAFGTDKIYSVILYISEDKCVVYTVPMTPLK